jgi:hypothetical protein
MDIGKNGFVDIDLDVEGEMCGGERETWLLQLGRVCAIERRVLRMGRDMVCGGGAEVRSGDL